MTATRIPAPVRRPVQLPWLACLALLGILAGVTAKAADESGITWAGDLGTYPAAWVFAVALIGRYAPTPPWAAARAAVFFAAMTVAYYAWASEVLGFGWSPLLLPWLVLSCTAVAAASAGAWWGTLRSGPVPGALMAVSAGIALAGGSVQRLYWSWTGEFPDAGARPVQAAVDVLVAVVLTVVLPRHVATRLWSLVLVVPLAGLASLLLQRLYQLIG